MPQRVQQDTMAAEEVERNQPATTTGGAMGDFDRMGSPARRSTGTRNAPPRASLSSLQEEDTGTHLAAASEKLEAARRAEQKKKKRKPRLATCYKALSPMKLMRKLRDVYVRSCVMAAEKGDFADLAASHPGMVYGSNVLSRNISQRQDREREEVMLASLSRQASSRQESLSGPLEMTRNTSTGASGMTRHASTGMPGFERRGPGSAGGAFGLPRNASTGMPGLRLSKQSSSGMARSLQMLGRKPSTRSGNSDLFSAGRETYREKMANGSGANQPNSMLSQQSHKVVDLPIAGSAQRSKVGDSASGPRTDSKPAQ